jgi:hypothetical protein
MKTDTYNRLWRGEAYKTPQKAAISAYPPLSNQHGNPLFLSKLPDFILQHFFPDLSLTEILMIKIFVRDLDICVIKLMRRKRANLFS